MQRGTWAVIGLCLLGPLVCAPRADARQRDSASEAPPVSPAEIQRMFDAYALVQAQDQLKLSDEQYSRFLSRFKALQEIRRRSQAERARSIQELRRLAVDPKTDETTLKERLKALQDLELRAAADVRKAQEGVDQVLDARQQAQFRAFEELMERRKIEIVTRARQNNRLNNRGSRGRP
jgi:Spy/CpxP family protein refolding chaperone